MKQRPSLDDVENAVAQMIDAMNRPPSTERMLAGARKFFARHYQVSEVDVEVGLGSDGVLRVLAPAVCAAQVGVLEVDIKV